MSDEERRIEATGKDGVEIRTPASFHVRAGQVPGLSASVQPMAGAQNGTTTCPLQAHQLICVSGEVTTNVRVKECTATVRCLDGGIGECPPGPPPPCKFKFFQNLCVQVDVEFEANANCVVDRIVCLETNEGPCPTV